jgi:hypothetical protein
MRGPGFGQTATMEPVWIISAIAIIVVAVIAWHEWGRR